MRFEREVLDLLKAKGVLENMIGLREAFFDLLTAEGQVIANIGAAKALRRAISRTAQLGAGDAALVHLDSVRRHRLFEVGDLGQLVVLDFDQFQRLLGDLRIVSANTAATGSPT